MRSATSTSAIMALSTTNLRTVMGSMDLDETLSKRDEINARLLAVVDHATEAWGVKITRVELKDIRPPADIVNAMTRQMKAEREKRAAILEAEGMRASEILRAEGEKQAKILQAEGLKEAAFREAEARERVGRGRSQRDQARSATRSQAAARQAINYFIAQKYVEAIGKFATSPNAKTILFPVEATQLMGTLGGIGELAKEVLGGEAGGAPPRQPSAAGQRRPRRAAARARRAEDRRLMLDNLEPGWLWAIGGVLLLIAEIIAPGFFLVFVGAAAIATGAVHLAVRPRHRAAAGAVRALRVLAVMVGKRWYGEPDRSTAATRCSTTARRGWSERSVTVVAAVDDHGGRVRVGDGEWNARGGPAAPGERVRITGVDGNCLIVEAERTLPPA